MDLFRSANEGIDQNDRNFLQAGEAERVANAFNQIITELGEGDIQDVAPKIWKAVCDRIITPAHPPALLMVLFAQSYQGWDENVLGPWPAWWPDKTALGTSNIGQVMAAHGFTELEQLRAFSVTNGRAFYPEMMGRLDFSFRRLPEELVDLSDPTAPRWFPGSLSNVADFLSRMSPDAPALIYERQDGIERVVTCAEMGCESNRVANALRNAGIKQGDYVAFYASANPQAVAAYWGAIKAGCPVVLIPTMYKDKQLQVRLEQLPEPVKLVITQDNLWGNRDKSLYRDLTALNHAPKAVVISDDSQSPKLRPGDASFDAFVAGMPEQFAAVDVGPEDPVIVHYSSGSTGVPKAIPWTIAQVIGSSIDTHLMRDLKPGDKMTWTTTMGWMMFSTLKMGALANKAVCCVYDGDYGKRGFGLFVEKHKINVVGVVADVPAAWIKSGCMEGINFEHVKAFGVTGSSIARSDALWLMARKHGMTPLLNTVGGTELARMMFGDNPHKPISPGMFNSMGYGIEIVFPEGNDFFPGEAGIVMQRGGDRTPPMGVSIRFLNPGRDHRAAYFGRGAVTREGELIREHGDAFASLSGGFFRYKGRAGPGTSFNIGGIKAGSAELEQAILEANIPGLQDVVVIGVPPADEEGGRDQICVFYFLKQGTTIPEEKLKEQMEKAIGSQAKLLAHIDYMFKETDPRNLRNPGGKAMYSILYEIAQKHVQVPDVGRKMQI